MLDQLKKTRLDGRFLIVNRRLPFLLTITGKITSDFAQQKFSSPLPANSDENRLPLDPAFSEFVGSKYVGSSEVIFPLILSLLALLFTPLATATAATMELGKSQIQLVDGTSIEGTIGSIDQSGSVLGDGIRPGLNLEEILLVVTQRTPQADPSANASVLTIGGGKMLTRDPALSDEKVIFLSASGKLELPLQAIRAIVWSDSIMVQATIKRPSKENDTVVVETADGDRGVEGILESIDSDFVRINYKGESKKIGLAKVRAVVTADLGLSKLAGAIATVNLVDNSKLVGVISEVSNDELTLLVSGRATVKLKTSDVTSFSIASDRLLYLSDSDPIEVQEKSIFAVQRPWKRDRSVENNSLSVRVGESEKTVRFAKGLGTQSFSRLVFANSNDFDRFNAVAGIDAETHGRGDCQMVVRGDGIELWSERIRASDGPQPVNVDISGMKQIELIVYAGEEFDLGDHADWGDAKFLKTK